MAIQRTPEAASRHSQSRRLRLRTLALRTGHPRHRLHQRRYPPARPERTDRHFRVHADECDQCDSATASGTDLPCLAGRRIRGHHRRAGDRRPESHFPSGLGNFQPDRHFPSGRHFRTSHYTGIGSFRGTGQRTLATFLFHEKAIASLAPRPESRRHRRGGAWRSSMSHWPVSGFPPAERSA